MKPKAAPFLADTLNAWTCRDAQIFNAASTRFLAGSRKMTLLLGRNCVWA